MHALRLGLIVGPIVLVLLAACTKQRNPSALVEAADCSRMIDRYATLLTPDAAVQAQVRARVVDAGVLASCAQEITRAQYDCAMRAADPDAFETCIQ